MGVSVPILVYVWISIFYKILTTIMLHNGVFSYMHDYIINIYVDNSLNSKSMCMYTCIGVCVYKKSSKL